MFHNLIKDIWQTTPGLDNVMLAGVDGIVIARHHESDTDDFIAAEAAALTKDSQKFGDELDSGTLNCLCLYYDDSAILIQMVTEEYFLIGVIKDVKFLGPIRYRLSLKAHEWYSAIA